MNVDARYQHILSELKLGNRALTRFSSDEMDYLEKTLPLAQNPQELEKLLCLIEHSIALNPKLEGPLTQLLNSDLPDHLIIFSLNAARKHIILTRFQRGERLVFEFLEALKKLLHSPSPEVVEWTLRTIEECGNQGVYFLKEFDKIKPAPWKWFNAHSRAVRELITLLERRWRKFEKPNS